MVRCIGDRLYQIRQEAIADLQGDVAVYYNAKYLYWMSGYKTSLDYEKDLYKVSRIS